MASENISFDQIPSSILKPGKYFEFNTKLANSALPGNEQKVLLIGQMSSAGSATADQSVQVFDTDAGDTLFGTGSILALMVRSALKANKRIRLYCLPVDDATGVQRTFTLTVAVTTAEAGEIILRIGGKRVAVVVAAGDADSVIAASIVTAVGKVLSEIPFTAAATLAVATLTAVNDGTLANQVPVLVDSAPTGVIVTGAQGVAGATDPDITTALGNIFSERFQLIACSLNDTSTNLPALKTHIDDSGDAIEQRGQIAIYVSDPADNIAAATSKASTVDGERIVGGYSRSSPNASFAICAALAATKAQEEDPARPLNTLVLTGIGVPAIEDRLSRTEQETLLAGNVTPLETASNGAELEIVRMLLTDSGDAFFDVTTMTILDFTRDSVRTRLESRFPRSKLSSRTPGKVRDEVIDVLRRLAALEILENVEENIDGVLVERDLQDNNRLNIKIPADVVNGLHVIAGRIDLLL